MRRHTSPASTSVPWSDGQWTGIVGQDKQLGEHPWSQQQHRKNGEAQVWGVGVEKNTEMRANFGAKRWRVTLGKLWLCFFGEYAREKN